MIPIIGLIVAIYAFVRLLSLVLRTGDREEHVVIRVLSVLALIAITFLAAVLMMPTNDTGSDISLDYDYHYEESYEDEAAETYPEEEIEPYSEGSAAVQEEPPEMTEDYYYPYYPLPEPPYEPYIEPEPTPESGEIDGSTPEPEETPNSPPGE